MSEPSQPSSGHDVVKYLFSMVAVLGIGLLAVVIVNHATASTPVSSRATTSTTVPRPTSSTERTTTSTSAHGRTTAKTRPARATTTTVPATTTTTTPSAKTLGPHVTAVGDSVMLDYAANLQADLPGIHIDASVGEQWIDGISSIEQLRSAGQLGSIVVVALGTNGAITTANVHAMLAALAGVKTIVFVTNYVDEPWQNPNNAILRQATSDPRVRIADWAALAANHPSWFYSDGTHLPIGGAGASAAASLVTTTVLG